MQNYCTKFECESQPTTTLLLRFLSRSRYHLNQENRELIYEPNYSILRLDFVHRPVYFRKIHHRCAQRHRPAMELKNEKASRRKSVRYHIINIYGAAGFFSCFCIIKSDTVRYRMGWTDQSSGNQFIYLGNHSSTHDFSFYSHCCCENGLYQGKQVQKSDQYWSLDHICLLNFE